MFKNKYIRKCINYELCNEILPEIWYHNKNLILCTNCHILFGNWGNNYGKGILEFNDNIECPICLEIKRGVSQPRCMHYLCLTCFIRCYYGKDSPDFPYPELENEYYHNPENPKWENDYPLINIYINEYIEWETTYIVEEHLSKCCICRK